MTNEVPQSGKILGSYQSWGCSNTAQPGCETPPSSCAKLTWISVLGLANWGTFAIYSTTPSLSVLICKRESRTPPLSWQWNSEMLMGTLASWDNWATEVSRSRFPRSRPHFCHFLLCYLLFNVYTELNSVSQKVMYTQNLRPYLGIQFLQI